MTSRGIPGKQPPAGFPGRLGGCPWARRGSRSAAQLLVRISVTRTRNSGWSSIRRGGSGSGWRACAEAVVPSAMAFEVGSTRRVGEGSAVAGAGPRPAVTGRRRRRSARGRRSRPGPRGRSRSLPGPPSAGPPRGPDDGGGKAARSATRAGIEAAGSQADRSPGNFEDDDRPGAARGGEDAPGDRGGIMVAPAEVGRRAGLAVLPATGLAWTPDLVIGADPLGAGPVPTSSRHRPGITPSSFRSGRWGNRPDRSAARARASGRSRWAGQVALPCENMRSWPTTLHAREGRSGPRPCGCRGRSGESLDPAGARTRDRAAGGSQDHSPGTDRGRTPRGRARWRVGGGPGCRPARRWRGRVEVRSAHPSETSGRRCWWAHR
jgi:hypothetical protein